MQEGGGLLEHGGKLKQAAKKYNIPESEWLDLSTGINPNGWTVPTIPENIWQRLPEQDEHFINTAKNYYAAQSLLPVAGSQAAIQALPKLRPHCRVSVLTPCYAEHAHAWKQASHHVTAVNEKEIDKAISTSNVLVLANPNNPTGKLFHKETLLSWHQQLAMKGGWLIVDEAFMDTTPEYSLANKTGLPGLIILRSIGKFFGLAGIRTGFVLAEQELLNLLAEQLGPWAVNGPALYATQRALQDINWQQETRHRLENDSQRLLLLLEKNNLVVTAGTSLFQWIVTEQAREIHESLAQQGILTRLFEEPASLRFGLPGNSSEWKRLEIALLKIKDQVLA